MNRYFQYIFLLFFVFSLYFFNSNLAFASINESFTFQGKITNTDGTNPTSTTASCIVSGASNDTCKFRVRLYDGVTGGTLRWEETKSNVEIGNNDGIFNLTLNCGGTFSSCNQNGGPSFSSGKLYIDVAFSPDGTNFTETFSPRREMTSTPYAFNAKTADNILVGSDTTGDLLYRNSSGNLTRLGIGTTGQVLKVSSGNLPVWDTISGGTPAGQSGQIQFNDGSSAFGASSNLFWDAINGRLGVGTATPNKTLDVVGSANISGTLTAPTFIPTAINSATRNDFLLTSTHSFTGSTYGQADEYRFLTEIIVTGTCTGDGGRDCSGTYKETGNYLNGWPVWSMTKGGYTFYYTNTFISPNYHFMITENPVGGANISSWYWTQGTANRSFPEGTTKGGTRTLTLYAGSYHYAGTPTVARTYPTMYGPSMRGMITIDGLDTYTGLEAYDNTGALRTWLAKYDFVINQRVAINNNAGEDTANNLRVAGSTSRVLFDGLLNVGGTTTPTLYTDGATGRVGIGITTPSTNLSANFQVVGTVRFDVGSGSDTTGDILYRNSSGNLARLGIGSAGQVLGISSGLPSWVAGGGTGTPAGNNTEIQFNSSGTSFGASSDFAWDNTANAKKLTANGAILSTGAFGSGLTVPNLGAGTRMMWYPKKSAFRVGSVNSAQWDNVNIGNNSFASGESTIASGDASVSMGSWTIASGVNSTAMGINTISSGYYSTSMGVTTIASGDASTSIGRNTTATAYSSTVLGSCNYDPGTYSNFLWEGSDALFVVGNGVYNDYESICDNNSNAITLLKNGNLGIGSTITSPLATLHVGGTIRFDLGSDTTGDLLYRNSSGNLTRLGIGTAGQVLGISGGLPAWVTASGGGTPAGSDTQIQFNDGGNFGADSKFIWNKTSGYLGLVNNGSTSSIGTDVLGNLLINPQGLNQAENPFVQIGKYGTGGTNFFDDFSSSTLGSDWIFTTTDSSSYSLSNQPGKLEMTVVAGSTHDLYAGATNAPRITKDITGISEFTFITEINSLTTSSQSGAGVVLWKDGTNFAKIGLAYNGSYTFSAYKTTSGSGATVISPTSLSSFSSYYIRIIKRGISFNVETSTDSITWTLKGSFSLDGITSIGLYGMNWQNPATNSPQNTITFNKVEFQANNIGKADLRVSNDLSVGGYGKYNSFFSTDMANGNLFFGYTPTFKDITLNFESAGGTVSKFGTSGNFLYVDNDFAIRSDSKKLLLGVGSDVNLYRSATDTLKTDDNLVVAGTLNAVGAVTFNNVATGTVSSTAGLLSGSDIRWKKDIATLSSSLNKIKQLRAVGYNWRADEFTDKGFTNARQMGFIAQELQNIFPDSVREIGDGYLGIDYSSLIAPAIGAIQEQQDIIDQNINDILSNKNDVDNISLNINNINQTLSNINAFKNPVLTEIENLKNKDIETDNDIMSIEAEIKKISESQMFKAISSDSATLDLISMMASQSSLLTEKTSNLTLEINEISSRVSNLENKNALDSTQSAYLSNSSSTLEALMVSSKANIYNLDVVNIFNVGNLQIDGTTGSIETLSANLKLQPSSFAGVEMVGGKVEVSKTGNLEVKEGVVKGNSTNRGKITLPANTNSIRVNIAWSELPESVIAVPTYQTELWVDNVDNTGFTIYVKDNNSINKIIYWNAIW